MLLLQYYHVLGGIGAFHQTILENDTGIKDKTKVIICWLEAQLLV